MLHHPFCVEMRHYFYTNGDKVKLCFKLLGSARWGLLECSHGLHSWDNLQNHEVLPENEINGTTPPR